MSPPPLPLRSQDGELLLHWAVRNNASEAVVKALLAAHPDGAKEKDRVRGRGRAFPALPLPLMEGDGRRWQGDGRFGKVMAR